jgi:hypothetical protein
MKEGISEIAKRYKAYNKAMMDIWEDYNFLNYYLPQLHNDIKTGGTPEFKLDHLYNSRQSTYDKKDLYGVIDHLQKKIIPTRALLEAVSATEHFLQDITFRVYRDHDYKLQNSATTPEQASKLMNVILGSADRDEMIYKIAEEKIRGIFYGNPVDFFMKDKAKVGFEDYFKNNHQNTLKIYAEIIARRNIYTHNNGKIDRKYKREVQGTTLRLGQILEIDKEYIKEVIIVLRGLAVSVTKLVIENTYRSTNTNRSIERRFNTFEKLYKDN